VGGKRGVLYMYGRTRNKIEFQNECKINVILAE
jgi:hypothetical protein